MIWKIALYVVGYIVIGAIAFMIHNFFDPHDRDRCVPQSGGTFLFWPILVVFSPLFLLAAVLGALGDWAAAKGKEAGF